MRNDRRITKMKIHKRILTGILLGVAVSARADASKAGDQLAGEARAAMADRPIVFDAIIGDQASCQEVSTAELQAALNTARAVVLDARPFEEYAVSHIPGARAVPGKPGTTPAPSAPEVNSILSTISHKNTPRHLSVNGAKSR